MQPRHPLLALPVLVALLVAACGGDPGLAPTATPPPGTPAATFRSSPSPSPTPLPIAELDPSMTAEQLFDEEATAAQLDLGERSRQTRDGAVVHDVRFTGADGRDVAAYIVTPLDRTPAAGVLFLHWLGDDFSSREEFVTEAVALAGKGIESILITQHFPWAEQPSGVDHDRVAIGLQVRTIRRALTVLASQVGSAPIAIVGHDYGAMYGILAASVDPRPAALVAMAPDSTWVNWFVTYFHVVDAADVAAYSQAMADVDPVTRIAGVSAPILLQFGTTDTFVSADAADTLAGAAPGGTKASRYDTGHRLDDQARTDRDAWLLAELRVAPASS